MKYLKAFNESLDRNELREFCEMYLAYLLDKSHFNLEVFSSTKDILIIEILDNPDTTFSGDKIFTWLDVKDHIIPFLKMLDKSYDINIIRAFQYGKDHMSTGLMPHSIRSIERLSDDTKMKSITISVSNKRSLVKKIKSFFVSESVAFKKIEWVKVQKVIDEINDLCEKNLVYLQDEGFVYNLDISEDSSYHKELLTVTKDSLYDKGDLIFKICKGDQDEDGDFKNINNFSWNEIKDRFIPFLIMLRKEFNVLEEVQFSITHENVYLESDEWFTINELCDDNFEIDYEIREIIINIDI